MSLAGLDKFAPKKTKRRGNNQGQVTTWLIVMFVNSWWYR